MRNFIKYISICLLVLFSFYYTNTVSKIVINNSDLMKNINDEKSKYESDFVNAQINEMYIIPGINGIKVDQLDSYYAMKQNDNYNKNLFVFREVKPQNSYYDHLDLIINKGNSLKNSVSLIVENNEDVINYLIKNHVAFDRLIDNSSFIVNAPYQQINNDFLHYEQVDKLLDKNKINTNICIVNNDNYELCKDYGKFLVKPTYVVNNQFLINKYVESGNIFYIEDDCSITRIKLLLKRIAFFKLKIVYLDYLISEDR